MSVEIERVFKAAESLQAEGIVPSVRKVSERIDAGKHSYVAPYLALYNKRETDLEKVENLPDDYVKSALQSAVSVWEAAHEHAGLREAILLREIERLKRHFSVREREFSEERCAHEAKWNEERDAVIAQCDALEISKAKLLKNVGELEVEAQELKAKIATAETCRALAEQRKDSAEARLSELQRSLREQTETMKLQVKDLQTRAVRAEERKVVLEEQLCAMEKGRERDAKRYDELLKAFVAATPSRQSIDTETVPVPGQCGA